MAAPTVLLTVAYVRFPFESGGKIRSARDEKSEELDRVSQALRLEVLRPAERGRKGAGVWVSIAERRASSEGFDEGESEADPEGTARLGANEWGS